MSQSELAIHIQSIQMASTASSRLYSPFYFRPNRDTVSRRTSAGAHASPRIRFIIRIPYPQESPGHRLSFVHGCRRLELSGKPSSI